MTRAGRKKSNRPVGTLRPVGPRGARVVASGRALPSALALCILRDPRTVFKKIFAFSASDPK